MLNTWHELSKYGCVNEWKVNTQVDEDEIQKFKSKCEQITHGTQNMYLPSPVIGSYW